MGPLELLPDAGKLIRRHLSRATVLSCSASNLVDTLEHAATGARALGIAVGAGSANAAAAVAHRHRLPLLLIPAGTHNHFARDLGLRRPSAAFVGVQRGTAVAVDLATIAEQPFLKTASLGGYAAMGSARERLADRIGKWPRRSGACCRCCAMTSRCA